MHEIEKLEKEWRRYKRKKRAPLLIALSVAIFFAGGYLALQNSGTTFDALDVKNEYLKKSGDEAPKNHSAKDIYESERDSLNESEEKTENITRAESTIVQKEKPSSANTPKQPLVPEESEKSVVLNPDTDFLDSISSTKSNNKPQKHAKAAESIKHERVSKKAVPVKKSDDTQNGEKMAANEDENVKVSTLQIKSSKTNNTLEYLIGRFNEKRDPKLASYIAQSYYKKGNYNEAARWSVIANSLDPSSEESWLTFARSKAKMGQKEDAIKALKVYLNQYSSKKVKSFLHSLEAGR